MPPSSPWIDLRSDTATLPTPGMRRAMAEADLGDDMSGEDPTVNRLEGRVAELLGKEAAMFVPSGTMSNQIALRLHLRPGDELLCEQDAHIYLYETGGPAAHSGATCRLIPGRQGVVDVDDFRGKVRPDNIHQVRTRLVALENTHNRGNGAVLPLENVRRVTDWARENKLLCHLDGARLFNAVAATGTPAAAFAEPFDTVSVCFSKGLGCPVGSILISDRERIKEARRLRKLFGGAMRQAGVLAAAALYALDHHVERLAEDHANAQVIAAALSETALFALTPQEVPTNIMWAPLTRQAPPAARLAEHFAGQGIRIGAYGPETVRMVTHLGVSRADAERVAEAVRALPLTYHGVF